MQASSRKTPCPCCGRTRTDHCRFDLNSDAPIVLCHNGVSSGPPQLRIGDTTTFAGITWALIKTNAGHSGNSYEFRPHRQLSRRERRHYRRHQARQQINDLTGINEALATLDTLATQALDTPPLQMMLDADIKAARDITQQAYDSSKALLARTARLKRIDATITPVWEELSTLNRDLRYQLADLSRYCSNPAEYWAAFINGQPTPTPLPVPERQQTDWEFWASQRGAA